MKTSLFHLRFVCQGMEGIRCRTLVYSFFFQPFKYAIPLSAVSFLMRSQAIALISSFVDNVLLLLLPSLITFKICSFSMVFRNVPVMCLVVIFFVFILLVELLVSVG